MTTKNHIKEYKKQLIEEKERIELEQRYFHDVQNSQESFDYGNHPAEGATEASDRITDEAMYKNSDEMLAKIEDALHKIEDGTYGKCNRCGEEISQNRLKAIPYATFCLKCQESIEGR